MPTELVVPAWVLFATFAAVSVAHVAVVLSHADTRTRSTFEKLHWIVGAAVAALLVLLLVVAEWRGTRVTLGIVGNQ